MYRVHFTKFQLFLCLLLLGWTKFYFVFQAEGTFARQWAFGCRTIRNIGFLGHLMKDSVWTNNCVRLGLDTFLFWGFYCIFHMRLSCVDTHSIYALKNQKLSQTGFCILCKTYFLGSLSLSEFWDQKYWIL